MDWSQYHLGENSLWQLLWFFTSLAAGYVVSKIVKYSFDKSATRNQEKERMYAAALCRGISKSSLLFFLALGFYVGIFFLNPQGLVFLSRLGEIALTVAIAYLAFNLVEVPNQYFINLASRTESKLDDMLVPVVRKCLRLTIIVLGIVQIAQILSGEEITSVIAGLGIGGLAVALAAQDTIKNFFGSLVILSDKPFELGERIHYDTHDGIIEEVGLRSTRLRRLDGHQVTIPNGELANKPIHNIGRRPYIRRLFNITVTYDTSPEKMREAKEILDAIFSEEKPYHESLQKELSSGKNEEFPPRVYFSDFNDASLGFLCIYWYHPPAYWDYMEYSEWVNMEILKRFNEAGIDFAFPTQTLHLAGDDKRPLQVGVHWKEGDFPPPEGSQTPGKTV